MTFDGEGSVFVSYQAATFLGAEKPDLTNPAFGPDRIPAWRSNNGVFVVRSDDGGASWLTPVAVASHMADAATEVIYDLNPEIAIDTIKTLPNGEPNPLYGNIYAIWTRVYPPGQFPNSPNAPGGTEARLGVSRDGGRTWDTQPDDEITKVALDVFVFDAGAGTNPGEGFVDFPHLAIGLEGELYISLWAGQNFGINVTRDGGNTFHPSSFASGNQIVFGTSFTTTTNQALPGNGFRTAEKRAIAADQTRLGTLYAVEPISVFDANGALVDPADIYFGRSNDFAQVLDYVVLRGASSRCERPGL